MAFEPTHLLLPRWAVARSRMLEARQERRAHCEYASPDGGASDGFAPGVRQCRPPRGYGDAYMVDTSEWCATCIKADEAHRLSVHLAREVSSMERRLMRRGLELARERLAAPSTASATERAT